MTWTEISGVIGIVMFLATIITYSVKVSKAFAELSVSNKALRDSVDKLNQTIDNIARDNEEEHDQIYEKLEEHNVRITKLETKEELS